MEQFEYRVLEYCNTGGGFRSRLAWFDAGEGMGEATGEDEDLPAILNRYGEAGWEVVSHVFYGDAGEHAMWDRILLKRPRQAPEITPALAPGGRGDEPRPAGKHDPCSSSSISTER